MPLTHSMATRLGKKLNDVRKNGGLWWLRPDGKTEVTIEYLQRADPLFRLIAQSRHEAHHLLDVVAVSRFLLLEEMQKCLLEEVLR